MGLFDRFRKKTQTPPAEEPRKREEAPPPEVMTKRREEWQAKIKAYFHEVYAAKVLPSRELMTKAENCQRQIIGSTIHAWLTDYGPKLLAERELIRGPFDAWDSEPVIVITSTVPGLVAACDMLSSDPTRVFYLTNEAFKVFHEQHPDPEFQWHVTYESRISEVPNSGPGSKSWGEHPLAAHECYWVHTEAYMLGPLFGQGWEHLWKWDGEKPVLLQQRMNNWVS
jgi:hypothetical protein